MAVLFREPLQTKYVTTRFGFSYCFCIAISLATIILPFFLAFTTKNFWVKQQFYLEQPRVLYRREFMVFAYSANTGTMAFSSIGPINDMFYDSQVPVDARSSMIDSNFDLKPDLYDFNFTITADPREIRNVKVLTFYDYAIEDVVKEDMVVMAYADVDTPQGASLVFVDGDLALKQKRGIKTDSVARTLYNTTFIHYDATSQNYLPTLLERYNNRNETAVYEYGNPTVLPAGSDSETTIRLKVRIPPNQVIQYVPPFAQVMKFAWMQYLSLLLPLAVATYWFARFLFGNGILNSSIIKPKNIQQTN